MCGIFGIYESSGSLKQDSLSNGIAALKHRGPDGCGTYISGDRKVGLAHSRLAIMDPLGGAQPLFNEDRSITAVVNGEFYDFEVLRAQLIACGHSFKTNSDSEVLLHLYEEFGTGCLNKLRGEFAFLLWDAANEMLFAARDRFGIKPLLYTYQGKGLLFASEAKAFFASGVTPAWDYKSLFQALSLHYKPLSATFFEGIHQLQPGHYLTLRNGEAVERSYWDLDYSQVSATPSMTDSEWESLFSQNLREAVRTRLRSDVPVAFYLSGGLDSASIAALATKASRSRCETFTVSFPESQYDEGAIAARMAAYLGVKNHTIKAGHSEMLSALSDSVYFSEGLAINGHLPAKYLLSRSVHRAGIKVVLTGEGADELLAGYPHFQLDTSCRAGDRELLNRSYYASQGIMLSCGETLPTAELKNRIGFIPEFLAAKAGFGFRMKPFLSAQFSEAFRDADPFASMMESLPDKTQLLERSPLRVSMYLWNKLGLSNYILHPLGDGTEMANGVEARLPFLDHMLFEKMRGLPQHLMVKDGCGKILLRSAASGLVTPEIRSRCKHPFFSPPLLDSKSESVLKTIKDTISGARLPFLNKKSFLKEIETRTESPAEEKKLIDPLIFMILSLCHMEERFAL